MLFLLENFLIKIFATSEKLNLPRYIENDILYNFNIVSGIYNILLKNMGFSEK